MAQKRDLEPKSIYLPPEVIERIEKMAAESYESFSMIVRRVMVEWLKEQK